MKKDEIQNILSTEALKKAVDNSPYHTFFKDRLYIYDAKSKNIVGYMLKEDYDPEKTLKGKDKSAAEAFANIELKFKNAEEEALFDYDAFVDTVIAELEVWLSYDAGFETE